MVFCDLHLEELVERVGLVRNGDVLHAATGSIRTRVSVVLEFKV